ncbi:PDZ domain-containing RING finger protein 4 [Denticeps clupeoides]|uniref:PDZ domain-containing protein n=1 Tax=Denticeps clupeoides TaxID=299321 RepID=A0AAY4EN58_9TELE|nr:PDZ domain-containing RING finger protein 4 [Denticeps clupeoides]
MGCNLCTLQKREEHYKLLYEIAQVNGRDFPKSSHEGAVEAIRKEPIVVQVLRRNPIARNHGNFQEVCLVDVCTQTDITFEHIMALAKLRPTTPPVPDICPFLLSDSCHSLHTMEHEYFECPEYLSNAQAEVERPDEFEYEEVQLCRLNSQEKLGLTLCYRTDEEEDTAIYVSQVGQNSIAARDGRIREGDRILQINGRDIQNREEAVALLSSEDTRNIVLLVTRPEMQVEEGWVEENSEFLEELRMETVQEQGNEESQSEEQPDSARKETTEDLFTEVLSDLAQGKQDSQLRTQGEVTSHSRRSCRGRWEVAEPKLAPPRVSSLPQQGRRFAAQEKNGPGVEHDHFQQLLELKCQIRNRGECGLYYSRRSTIECSLTEQGGVEHELRMLNEELRSIEMECQSIMKTHQLRKSQQEPGRTFKIMGSNDAERLGKEPCQPRVKLADIREQPERWDSDKLRDKDSSSAYNTAESSMSTPLGMERSPDHSLQRKISLTNQKNLRSTLANSSHFVPVQTYSHTLPTNSSFSQTVSTPSPTHSLPTPGSPSQAHPGPTTNSSSLDQSQSNPSESDPALPADDERCDRKKSRGPPGRHASPYHTTSGGYHVPTATQCYGRSYHSYLQLLQQHSSSVEFSQSQLSLLSLRGRPGEPRLEWKVKVRADGTRYVARRPARDRILRERALRIREERSGGMTTDDDAVSELKMGRYWSKEERKQQLARAREQRRRREFMQRSRLECLRETGASGAEGRKEVNILELSQKKMMKKRNKKILDNWMTIQELMTHGARVPEGTKVHNAFLSVTTV